MPLRWAVIRDPAARFATQALLCTDLTVTPEQIIAWFVRRWQMEATFEEVRRHLGVETQRQWSPLAITRTTPVLLGLFSLVTLLAHPHLTEQSGPIRQAAWYRKRHRPSRTRWRWYDARSGCMRLSVCPVRKRRWYKSRAFSSNASPRRFAMSPDWGKSSLVFTHYSFVWACSTPTKRTFMRHLALMSHGNRKAGRLRRHSWVVETGIVSRGFNQSAVRRDQPGCAPCVLTWSM